MPPSSLITQKTESNQFDSYWRLNPYTNVSREDLRMSLYAAGCTKLPSSILKKTLVVKQQRVDRGMVLYEKFPPNVLTQCLFARHPEVGPAENYVSLLEMADEKREFPDFLNLPAELRMRVYRFYIEMFPQELVFPSQPPLARTCRQMRREVLPVFYQSHIFVLEYVFKGSKQFRAEPDTTLFLHSVPVRDVTSLRKLKITIGGKISPLKSDEILIDISLDLMDLSQVAVAVAEKESSVLEGLLLHNRPKVETSLAAATDRVRMFLEGVKPADGRRRLNIRMIHALRRVFEATLMEAMSKMGI